MRSESCCCWSDKRIESTKSRRDDCVVLVVAGKLWSCEGNERWRREGIGLRWGVLTSFDVGS